MCDFGLSATDPAAQTPGLPIVRIPLLVFVVALLALCVAAGVPTAGEASRGYQALDSTPAARGGGRVADDAFEHGYKYHPRVRQRGVEDPRGHNFPYSFDDAILKEQPIPQPDGSLLYRKPGAINDTEGIFEIGLNPDTGTIFHRTFRSPR